MFFELVKVLSNITGFEIISVAIESIEITKKLFSNKNMILIIQNK